MTSAYTDLGVELMVTGENAGTWGDKTNTNLNLIEQISGGYITQAIAGSGTTAFSKTDGGTGSVVATRVIEFTGALTGSRIVTFPVLTENFYLIKNTTTNAETLQLKAATGSGATVTWAASDKGWKIVYFDGVATNTGVYDTGFSTSAGDVTLTGTQTLTNKTLTAPKIGTSILDTNGAELLLLTATGSAANEFTLANAASGNGPTLSATGETNVGININPKGTGVLKSGTAAVKIAGLETMWVPAAAMYGATTNGAAAEQVETTATRPDMKVLDFDAGTDEFAQFSVAFPKSWNEGTVTYQVYWTPASTNTGNCIFGLQGVSCGDSDTIDIAYGTAINITDAGIGTIEDQQVSAVSSAVTIAGSPAVDQQTYFQLFRDANAGGDTFSADARVLGIKIFFTTDAANDA
jgi:hypothetical protein